MFEIIIFILPCFVISDATVCFSQDGSCGNLVSDTDLLIVDIYDPQSYKKIINHIAREQRITLYFHTLSQGTGEFEIPLALFLNREIDIIPSLLTNSPESVIFTYTDFENYSYTSLSNVITNAKLKYIGEKKDLVEIQFNSFVYTHDLDSILLPLDQKVSLRANFLNCSTNALVSFETCSLLNITDNIYILAINHVDITIYPNKYKIFSVNLTKEATIINAINIGITIRQEKVGNIQLIAQDINNSEVLPTVTLINTYFLTFSGLWPNIKGKINNTITNSILLMVDIKCEYLPFNLILQDIYLVVFNLYTHFTLLGQLVSDSVIVFDKYSRTTDVLDVNLKYAECKIKTSTADIKLVIDYYKYVFSDQDSAFPITFAFSETQISTAIIKRIDFTGLSTYILNYNFLNLMQTKPKDEDLNFLLNRGNNFLKIPEIHYYYWKIDNITYVSGSSEINGLRNDQNNLHIDSKVNSKDGVINICTYGSLSNIETKLVIGNFGFLFPEYGTYLPNPSDVASCFDFNINEKKYFLTASGVDDLITIGLQNIPNKDMIFTLITDPFFSPKAFNFKFPPTDETIELARLLLSETSQLVGENKFVAKNVIFNGVIYNEMVKNEYECGSIETDWFSLKSIMNTDYVENLTVVCDNFDRLTMPIIILEDKMVVNRTEIMWNKVGNLTLIGSDLNLFMNSDKITHSFHIVSSAEGTTINFDGDWKNAQIEDSINVHANDFSTILNIMQPFNYTKLKFDGEGKISIKYIYSNATKVCVYAENILCTDYDVAIGYDNLSEIEAINSDFLDIQFSDFSDSNYSLLFDLSIYQAKQVKFNSLFNRTTNVTVIPPTENQDLLEFIFENILLTINSTEEKVEFNYLTLINSSIQSDANILEANSLTCTFKNLVGWREVIITKSLLVSGQFPDESFKVTLVNDIKDYTATVDLTSITDEIIFSDNSLRFHNGLFIFKDSHQGLPVRFVFNSSTIVFAFDPQAKRSINSFLQVDSGSSVSFNGLWSSIDHYFQILINCTFSLANEDVIRCDISGAGVLIYFSNSISTGINGSFYVSPIFLDYKPVLMIDTTLEHQTRTKVTMSDVIIDDIFTSINHSPFSFLKPNIDLELYNLKYDFEGLLYARFLLEFYLFEEGMASITFINDFYNFQIKNEIRILININGKLKSDDTYEILKHNISIIKGHVDDMLIDFKLVFLKFKNDSIRGFQDVIALDSQVDDTGKYMNLILYATGSPADSQYLIQYYNLYGELPGMDYYIPTESSIPSLFNSVSTNLRRIIIAITSSTTDESFRLSDVDGRFSNVSIRFMAFNANLMIKIDSPGSGVQDLNFMISLINNTEDISFGNVKRLYLTSTTFIPNFNMYNFSNLEYLETDMVSFRSLSAISIISSPKATFNISNARYFTFCENGWLISEDYLFSPIRILKSNIRKMKFMGARFTLSLENPGKQTKIPETVLIFSPLESETDILIMFNDGFDKITNFDQLKIEINSFRNVDKITVSTTFFPVPDIFPHNVKIEIIANSFSNQDFKLSEHVLTNETIDINFESVNDENRIIRTNSVNVNGLVKISFINNLGLLETNRLNLLDGGHFSINSFKIREKIIAQPKTSSIIEMIAFEDEIEIEIHWITNNWPTMMIGCEDVTKKPSNIRIILDEVSPNYEQYYGYTFHKDHTIFSGMFNCDSWKKHVHFESDDIHFKDGSDLIFNVSCSTDLMNGNEIMSIIGVIPLPLPSDNSESGNQSGRSKTITTVSIAVAAIIVVTIVIGLLVFFYTRRKFEMILQQKMKRKKILNAMQDIEEAKEKDEEQSSDTDTVDDNKLKVRNEYGGENL